MARSDLSIAASIGDFGGMPVIATLLGLLLAYTVLIHHSSGRGDGPGAVVTAWLATVAAQAGWGALGCVAIAPLTGLSQPFLNVSGASLTMSALVVGTSIGVLHSADPTHRSPRAPYPSVAAGARADVSPAAPGASAIRAVSRLGVATVAILLVAAALILAVTPPPMDNVDQINVPRGPLLSSDGQVLAVDVGQERTYPHADRYNDLGFAERMVTQRGIERGDACGRIDLRRVTLDGRHAGQPLPPRLRASGDHDNDQCEAPRHRCDGARGTHQRGQS